MKDVLETLYQCFYFIPWHTIRAKNERILKGQLNKEDFVHILRLTDAANLQLREVSLDSFLRGF